MSSNSLFRCMICHDDLALTDDTLCDQSARSARTDSYHTICQTRSDHVVCRTCFELWRSHPRTKCPLCRGPLCPIPPSLQERALHLFHTFDEGLRIRLAILVQDRPARWMIIGVYLYSIYHITGFTLFSIRELYFRYTVKENPLF